MSSSQGKPGTPGTTTGTPGAAGTTAERHTWAQRLGPALSNKDTARLLGRTPRQVRDDPGLLRLPSRTGQPVYPALQFTSAGPLPHLEEVLSTLGDALLPPTVASWLVTPRPELDARTPRTALLAGDRPAVLVLAQAMAQAAGPVAAATSDAPA